jgi:Pyruvate/2-oxoacid:ferredoxin oxidoreductase delta subunit
MKTQLTKEQLRSWHGLSIKNAEIIKESTYCACFFCLRIFPSTAINSWIKEKGAGAKETARCPGCGMDSVLPGGDEHDFGEEPELTPEVLVQMQRLYFND